MRSLKNFILEEALDQSIENIVKAIESGDANKMFRIVSKFVESNKDLEINSRDGDKKESGCFIGYIPKGTWNTARVCIKRDDQLFSVVAQSGEVYNEQFKRGVHANLFGNVWKIVYLEQIPAELEEAINNTK